MSLVLNTGAYPPLLETRRLVLENAGHIVVTRAGESEIALVCQGYPFDVAVIGQSAPANLKRRIFHLVRKHCGSARILELITPDSSRALEAADAWLEVQPMQAELFAQCVGELARR